MKIHGDWKYCGIDGGNEKRMNTHAKKCAPPFAESGNTKQVWSAMWPCHLRTPCLKSNVSTVVTLSNEMPSTEGSNATAVVSERPENGQNAVNNRKSKIQVVETGSVYRTFLKIEQK